LHSESEISQLPFTSYYTPLLHHFQILNVKNFSVQSGRHIQCSADCEGELVQWKMSYAIQQLPSSHLTKRNLKVCSVVVVVVVDDDLFFHLTIMLTIFPRFTGILLKVVVLFLDDQNMNELMLV